MEFTWSYQLDCLFTYTASFMVFPSEISVLRQKIDEAILKLGLSSGLFILASDLETADLYKSSGWVSKKDEFSKFISCFCWEQHAGFQDIIKSKAIEDLISFQLKVTADSDILKFSMTDWSEIVQELPERFTYKFGKKGGEYSCGFMSGFPLDFNSSSINLSVNHPKEKRIKFSISISSVFDIWFERVNSFNVDYQGEFGFIDNRAVAYQNTSRLNSFLRDMRSTIIALGGKWSISDFIIHSEVSSNGILLDGRIVYREDIEEGRVKLPE